MKPFGRIRAVADAVPAARDDLTQIRDDIERAVDVLTVVAVAILAIVLAKTLMEV